MTQERSGPGVLASSTQEGGSKPEIDCSLNMIVCVRCMESYLIGRFSAGLILSGLWHLVHTTGAIRKLTNVARCHVRGVRVILLFSTHSPRPLSIYLAHDTLCFFNLGSSSARHFLRMSTNALTSRRTVFSPSLTSIAIFRRPTAD